MPMRWAIFLLGLCTCSGGHVKEPATELQAKPLPPEAQDIGEHATVGDAVEPVDGAQSRVVYVEGRIVSFMPGGTRDVYVADIGSDDGVAVGDRGVFACTSANFDVTWVQPRRAKLEIDRAMMRQPGEKRVRVALGGAAPGAWCSEP